MLAVHQARDLLFLSENRCQTAYLSAKGSSDVLRLVRDKIFDTGHDLVQQRVAVNETTETWSNYEPLS